MQGGYRVVDPVPFTEAKVAFERFADCLISVAYEELEGCDS